MMKIFGDMEIGIEVLESYPFTRVWSVTFGGGGGGKSFTVCITIQANSGMHCSTNNHLLSPVAVCAG